MHVSNTEAARVFLRIAELMSYQEESPFKVRAYYRAALTLSDRQLPLAELAARNELEKLPGVGEAIAGKIREILNTGTCALHERLKSEVPADIQTLLRVPGLTPRLVRFLETEFQTTTVEQFVALAGSGGLSDLEGLALKIEDAGQMLRAAEALNALDTGAVTLLEEDDALVDPFADDNEDVAP